MASRKKVGLSAIKVGGIGPSLTKPSATTSGGLSKASRFLAAKSRTAQDDELQRIMTNLFPDQDQARRIMSLKDRDGLTLFTLKTREILLDVLAIVDQNGFEKTVEFLQSLESAQDVIHNNPLLEDVRIQLQAEDQLLEAEDEKISEGIYTCPKAGCGSQKIKYRTKQTRGGDEGETTSLRCTSCGKRWKDQ